MDSSGSDVQVLISSKGFCHAERAMSSVWMWGSQISNGLSTTLTHSGYFRVPLNLLQAPKELHETVAYAPRVIPH
jgi:hypothetical protein